MAPLGAEFLNLESSYRNEGGKSQENHQDDYEKYRYSEGGYCSSPLSFTKNIYELSQGW